MAKKGLGRGLGALMADNEPELLSSAPEPGKADGTLLTIPVSQIEPNRRQARKSFDEASLAELADSISAHGLLEPIAVRSKGNGYYEIVAGERRWRAARMAGLSSVPAILRELSDEEAALLSLIENLQREDLNPVEEAMGYRDLIRQFGLTQEEAASRVGKSRSNVTNLLRILKLPEKALSLVRSGALSYGHARTLLPLADVCGEDALFAVAQRVSDEGWSVRQTEKFVSDYGNAKEKQSPPENPVEKEYYRKLEKKIGKKTGRKVRIRKEAGGNGKLQLFFSSSEDLEKLIKALCGDAFFEEL